MQPFILAENFHLLVMGFSLTYLLSLYLMHMYQSENKNVQLHLVCFVTYTVTSCCLLLALMVGQDDLSLIMTATEELVAITMMFVGGWAIRLLYFSDHETIFDKLHHIIFTLLFIALLMDEDFPVLVIVLSLSQMSGITYHYCALKKAMGLSLSQFAQYADDINFFMTRVIMFYGCTGYFFLVHPEFFYTQELWFSSLLLLSCVLSGAINAWLSWNRIKALRLPDSSNMLSTP